MSGAVVLMAYIEGKLGTTEIAGITVTALPETPEFIKDWLIEGGKQQIKRTYPTVTDVRVVKDWFAYEWPDTEEGS